MQRYLMTLEPLLKPELNAELVRIVADFSAEGGPGPVLQQGLVRKREKDNNWVSWVTA